MNRVGRKPPPDSRDSPRLGLDGADVDEFLRTLSGGQLSGLPAPTVVGVEDLHRVFVRWSRQKGDLWPMALNRFVRGLLKRGVRRIGLNVSVDGEPRRRRSALVFADPPLGDSYDWARSGFVQFSAAASSQVAELDDAS
jgi:hypothetical protein